MAGISTAYKFSEDENHFFFKEAPTGGPLTNLELWCFKVWRAVRISIMIKKEKDCFKAILTHFFDGHKSLKIRWKGIKSSWTNERLIDARRGSQVTSEEGPILDNISARKDQIKRGEKVGKWEYFVFSFWVVGSFRDTKKTAVTRRTNTLWMSLHKGRLEQWIC